MYQITKGDNVVRLTDGVVIPADPENRDWKEYQLWLNRGNEPLPEPELSEDQLREQWKAERAQAVASIVVTTDGGRVFDGDEKSQNRMARAIVVLRGEPEGSVVQWVLSDNTVADIGLGELEQALKLAGLRQTELWLQA